MDVPTRHHRADVHGEVDVAHAGCAARVNDGVANLRALLFVQRNVRSSANTLIRCDTLHRCPRAALQSLELRLIGELASLGLWCLRRAGALVLFKLLRTAVTGLLALP